MPIDILIIEDSQTQAVLFQSLLQREGYTVMVAKEAIEGLAKVEECHPRLVLLDLELPGGISGFQLMNLLRTRQSGLPVIIMSHRPPDGNSQMARRLGASGYLSKAEIRERLCPMVHEYLVPGSAA